MAPDEAAPRARRAPRWLWLLLCVLVVAAALRLTLVGSARVKSGSMIPTLRVGDRVLFDKTAYGLRLPFSDLWLTQITPPVRGEVVVFHYPQEDGSESVGHDMIKRVVGVPGDRVRLRDGRLYYDGQPAPWRSTEVAPPCDAPADHACDDVRECVGQLTWMVRRHLPIAGRANRTREPTNWPPRIFNPMQTTVHTRLFCPPANRDWPDFRVPEGHLLVLGDNRDLSRDGRHFGLVPFELLVGRAERIWYAASEGSWWPDGARSGSDLRRPAATDACGPAPLSARPTAP